METNESYIRYVYLLSPIPNRSPSIALIRKHVAYLKYLDEEGYLVLCGPFADQKGGMVIIKAKDLEEAKNIAESDPFVKEECETYDLRVWELSCKENNHMGMG